ncbi:MAG: AEC family transporter [Kiritimatiellae bacterium]|nr:AEC family transporter [Kiritimatiellia bacterium]
MLHVFFKTAAMFVVMFAGYAVRRRGLVDERFNRQLSLLLINVFFPSLIFESLTRNFTWRTLLSNWTLPAGSAMIMLIGWLVGLACRPALRHQPRATACAFHFQCLMNNYSFLPIMLASLMLDSSGVARIVFSTIGAELCLWTVGIQVLTGNRGTPAVALRNLISMPMLSMAAGGGVLLWRHYFPEVTQALCDGALTSGIASMLGDALRLAGQATIPVSAVIVGARMAGLNTTHLYSRPMAAIVVLRLAVIPALATLLIMLLPFPPDTRRVLLIIAAQPCAMASVTLAEVYDSDASFAAASVLLTHVFCLLTIPLWLAAPWWR